MYEAEEHAGCAPLYIFSSSTIGGFYSIILNQHPLPCIRTPFGDLTKLQYDICTSVNESVILLTTPLPTHGRRQSYRNGLRKVKSLS